MQGCAGGERWAPATDQGPQQTPAPVIPPALDQAQFEADKRAVYKHPLFPLLALLLERCEQATGGSDAPSCDAFAADLRAFVQHQQRDRKPFLVDDPEIDGLMIKSIQVLRIHLLELEKVQELCRDFCNRYIACLKSKMQSENLLRTDYSSGDAFPGSAESNNNQPLGGSISEEHSSTSNSPQYPSMAIQQAAGGVLAGFVSQPSSAGDVTPSPVQAPPYMTTDQLCQQYAEQKASLQHPPYPQHPNSGLVVLGSTPIGQIGAGLSSVPSSDNSYTGNGSCGSASPGLCEDIEGTGGEESTEAGDEDGSNGRSKRGVLPRTATQAMRAWLFQHLVHPYPTEEEKRILAAQTRLTLLQVNNWFINARRRILQPMLDGKDNSGQNNKRKQSGGGGASKRFWPDSLSSLQPQITAGLLTSSDEEEDDQEESDSEQELVIDQQADSGMPRPPVSESADSVQFHPGDHN